MGRLPGLSMRVLLTTTDPVRLSFLVALLRDGGCAPVVLDSAISALEGGIGAFPRRLAVPEEEAGQALRVLREAGETW
ncbi:DUF2007 domain-containing protein [Falsiroseomonas sp. HW251]|uniref:putative signal transducing protein n=1 Tax=Falsiroseomonas sp. HW251 TaxID=3390998 RepID=UPI003D312021